MIRIITDGTSDISMEKAKILGIDILPLTVHFGEEDFIPNVNLSTAEFYDKLASSKDLPTTSQVNPYVFEELFQSYVDAGDEVVGIFISNYLSGTYQSAQIAKGTVNSESIHLIDSLSATYGLALLVETAVKLRDEGKSAKEIVSKIQELIPLLEIVIAVDTLDYLKKGGRISSTSAMIGGVLGINPIVCVKDGKVESAGKARGKKACLQWVLNHLKSNDFDNTYPVAFGHSNSIERLQECMNYMNENATIIDTITTDIGPVVGTHIGPKAFGIAYIKKS